jgi:hypothetical protein
MLERVPEHKTTGKPHEKSTPMGPLAAHIAELPSWVARSLPHDGFDFAPAGAPPMKPAQMKSRQELLEPFVSGNSPRNSAIRTVDARASVVLASGLRHFSGSSGRWT